MLDILTLIKDTIENGVTLTESIELGKLGTGESLVMQVAPSGTDETFLDKSISYELDLLFLRKSEVQTTCINELTSIANFLRKLKTYPNTPNIEWVNSFITTMPNFVGQEQSGEWIYSMVVSNKLSL